MSSAVACFVNRNNGASFVLRSGAGPDEGGGRRRPRPGGRRSGGGERRLGRLPLGLGFRRHGVGQLAVRVEERALPLSIAIRCANYLLSFRPARYVSANLNDSRLPSCSSTRKRATFFLFLALPSSRNQCADPIASFAHIFTIPSFIWRN